MLSVRQRSGCDGVTTWDGDPVCADPPYGACVVVYRMAATGPDFLILHRDHSGHVDGDWAWTPPAGVRRDGEAIADCAQRELLEETGLTLELVLMTSADDEWPVYAAEAPVGAVVTLDAEHDGFRWVSAEEAEVRCLPEVVGRQIRGVADAIPV
jgi:8-oxo-dGTP pyrophosphatase MutT (NUDIX family)